MPPLAERFIPVCNYDLAGTLQSGQAFRWQPREEGWEGIVGGRWVRLRQTSQGIHATAMEPAGDWEWLAHYLQSGVRLESVLATFPKDRPMQASVEACRGLRLLRQEPWECLATFILSSTKRIIQIQQMVHLLCQRFGDPIAVPPEYPPAAAFPSARRLAGLNELELRRCKLGFRAVYLLQTSRLIDSGAVDLSRLHELSCAQAREALVQLPGVGAKIADCVLLFAYGFQEAFPVDVWVAKALGQWYFPKGRPSQLQVRQFVAGYFGSHAGYAQQYLFHYMRTQGKVSRKSSAQHERTRP